MPATQSETEAIQMKNLAYIPWKFLFLRFLKVPFLDYH